METQSGIKVVGFIDPKSFEKKHKVSKPAQADNEPIKESSGLVAAKVRLGDTVILMSGRSGVVTGFDRVKGQGIFLLLDGEKESSTDADEDFVLSIVHPKIEVKKKQQLPTQIIHFFKDRSGKIIGRLESGKICIFDFTYRGEFVRDNEDWEVEIKEELSNKAIVTPLRKVVSSEENEAKLEISLKELSSKEWNKPLGRSFSPIPGKIVRTKKYKDR